MGYSLCMPAKLLQSRLTLCYPMTAACWVPLSAGLSRQEYWCGLSCLLQGLFLTQGLNAHLLWLSHGRQILYS